MYTGYVNFSLYPEDGDEIIFPHTPQLVTTYRALATAPIWVDGPLATDLGSIVISDAAIFEHASMRKGECKALRRMITLVWLVSERGRETRAGPLLFLCDVSQLTIGSHRGFL